MAVEGPRAAGSDLLDSAVELATEVFVPRAQLNMAQEFPLLYAEGNAGNLRVFADGGKVVSLVGMIERPIEILGTQHVAALIGSVCTDPDYRGQGLASRLLEDARAKAVRDGCDLMLISGGRGLYQRQGYCCVGAYQAVTVRRSRLPRKGRLTVREWRPGDVPALMRLQRAEPVRFVRTPAELLTLLGTGRIHAAAARTLVMEKRRQKQLLACFSYQPAGLTPRSPDKPVIWEMAGSRLAAAEGLRNLFEEGDAEEVVIACLDGDLEMKALASLFGWQMTPDSFHGTVGIIDPASFWERCAPLYRELLGEESFGSLRFQSGGDVRIGYREQEITLPGMEPFTQLVFLPPWQRERLELDLPEGSDLATILGTLFPLPLVNYGLDYV
jgi:GNAT superfamily N-acetyltransferase